MRQAATIGAISFVVGVLTVLLAQPLAAMPQEVIGAATVISGDSLQVKGYSIRLFGIDAPEVDQICKTYGKRYNCGHIAATALMDLTTGATVRCIPKEQMAEDLVASCYANDYDLSEGMIYTGWALALPDRGRRYKGLERGAMSAHRGLWSGEFVAPWDWRDGKRLVTKAE